MEQNGTLNVGDDGPGAPSLTTLDLEGTLTDGGTVNMYIAATLSFGAAPAGSECIISGVLNMDGATTIVNAGEAGGVPVPVQIEGGTLLTNSDIDADPDGISGALINTSKPPPNGDGSIEFTGLLHDLTVGGTYTQAAGGSLSMRIEDPANDPRGFGCDRILVGGTASIDGTLTVNAIGTLPNPLPIWAIITTGNAGPGGLTGDFTTKDLPAGISAAPDIGRFDYDVF